MISSIKKMEMLVQQAERDKGITRAASTGNTPSSVYGSPIVSARRSSSQSGFSTPHDSAIDSLMQNTLVGGSMYFEPVVKVQDQRTNNLPLVSLDS